MASNPRPALLGGVALVLLQLLGGVASAQDTRIELFDGESLDGWETIEVDRKSWTATDGVIQGGSLAERVTHNSFLATTESYQNFDLRLKIRIQGSGGLVNSGIQIRSVRVPGSSEMSGYQVDAGEGWWGKLYDESRRNRVIAESADMDRVRAAIHPDGWNEYRIRAEGPRIRSWINGTPALDYNEVEREIPLDGHIAIQVHSGDRVLVQVKDVSIEVLPATTRAMTWERLDQIRAAAARGGTEARTPEEELAGFFALDGFEVELVASDPVMNKVVDIAFDDAGRMWAITAVEYPLDGNESAGVAERYKAGGRDQVLVFDDVWREGPLTPRVFADGLFIPMAILPGNDGVLVGQGPDILRFHDDDGDGRADRNEVVLTGFGIQDSHLLPHRFVRAPGGWVYMAQGAFNSSNVKTTTGQVVRFDKCKVGRFQADGSRFEVVGIGLNNIWGFVLDRRGDKWIQEANDLGYPLVPFEHGRSYPGIGMDRFRPYSPWHPSYAEFRMGGTGMSGLALSQDRGGFPSPWDETFFIANPIVNAVQSIRARRDSNAPSDIELERAADFLISADKNFRPIAIHFGPDRCLYIVDWYNPIISHNEVPRDHPDRNRTSSRIWRIRHESQRRTAPIDVSQAASADLVALLGSDSTWAARAAWHQIVDRGAVELEPRLRALAGDAAAQSEARVLSLWSIGDLGLASVTLVDSLLEDSDYAVRREATRLAGTLEVDTAQLVQLLARAPLEQDPRVRLEAIAVLSSLEELTPSATALLLRFLRPVPDGPMVRLAQNNREVPTGAASDILFERSLVRIALEDHPEAVPAVLASDAGRALDAETRLYALLCTGTVEGARGLALSIDDAGRPPSPEELRFLALHAQEEAVHACVTGWISMPASRVQGLRMLLDSAEGFDREALEPVIVESARALLDERPTAESRALLMRIARELRIAELEDDVIAILDGGEADPLECLRALIELGCSDSELYYELATASLPGKEQRRLAAAALAGVQSEESFELLLELWPLLGRTEVRSALGSLLQRPQGATRLVAAIGAGEIETAVLDGSTLARLAGHLGEAPALVELERRVARDRLPVLRLSGDTGDFVDTKLRLEGPFTIEAWVRLDDGITNADGLLSAAGSFDLNFYDARLRLWAGPAGDVIIASRRAQPHTWTHVALTRAGDGELALYINGELDLTTRPSIPDVFTDLDVGRTIPGQGTAAWISEYRIWSVARSAAEIGSTFKRRLGRDSDQEGLELAIPGDISDGRIAMAGGARVEGALDAPPVLSDEEQRAEAEHFALYRGLAQAGGDLDHGRELFTANCATCHLVAGEGASIGPVLDGAAAKGTEGLLRAILTPNAGVESGYRTLIVHTTSGEILDGFLAGEDASSIRLRRKDREDLVLPRDEIESARFDSLSLMPEGLLEALPAQDVTDLFTYLRSLN